MAESSVPDPRPEAEPWPPRILGMGRCFRAASLGEDLIALAAPLAARMAADRGDAAAHLDFATLQMLSKLPEEGLRGQARALRHEQVFRVRPARGGLRVLMFVGPGLLNANVPIDYLLEGAEVGLDLVYCREGQPLPPTLPEHDLAVVGIGESDSARPLLEALAADLAHWPKPLLIAPGQVLLLARDRLHQVLAGAPGVNLPMTVRAGRDEVAALARGEKRLRDLLADGAWPLVVRPVGSHAGKGLEKIDGPEALAAYLDGQAAETLYLSRYVDYRDADGQFRKYRITLIDGRPYACHMAIADHWMLHYLNARMSEGEAKRAEEAHWFASFDEAFAVTHARAFQALHERLGLGFLTLDCAQDPEGRLLIFEADTAMMIHDLDPPEVFPYKHPQMLKVFGAFQELLRGLAGV